MWSVAGSRDVSLSRVRREENVSAPDVVMIFQPEKKKREMNVDTCTYTRQSIKPVGRSGIDEHCH